MKTIIYSLTACLQAIKTKKVVCGPNISRSPPRGPISFDTPKPTYNMKPYADTAPYYLQQCYAQLMLLSSFRYRFSSIIPEVPQNLITCWQVCAIYAIRVREEPLKSIASHVRAIKLIHEVPHNLLFCWHVRAI